MDNRIAEVEKMIADCNARTQNQGQLSAQSIQNWKTILEAIEKIQKAAVASMVDPERGKVPTQDQLKSEGKAKRFQGQQESDIALFCTKCGMSLKSGVRFCRYCGTRVRAL